MCNCGKNKATGTTKNRVTVQLAGGLKITKANLEQAKAYVASHPGSKIV